MKHCRISVLFVIFGLFSSLSNAQEKLPCGLRGTIEERIQDCSWSAGSRGGRFVLVARTKRFNEVFIDTSTGLLWGARLSSKMEHSAAMKACSSDLDEVARISEVSWRLPTRNEYNSSSKIFGNEIPNSKDWFWSSTGFGYSGNRDAWAYAGVQGVVFDRHVSERAELFIRCVASY